MNKICVICGGSDLLGLDDCDEKCFLRMKEFTCAWHQLGRLVALKYYRTQWRKFILENSFLVFDFVPYILDKNNEASSLCLRLLVSINYFPIA